MSSDDAAAAMGSVPPEQRPIGATKEPDSLPDWAIGPFVVDTEPVLEPTDRGWEAGRLFNLSVIEAADVLCAYYRATPDDRIDQDSRIGLAWSEDGRSFRRHAENPVLEPTESYEQRGCEDPKLYAYEGTYYMFYNPVWESEGIWGDPGDIRCNICLATSKDLIHWEKHGQLVPASLTGGWAKGAVIPKDPEGRPVRIDGEFLMYVGELATDHQLLGRSDDLRHWEFETTTFLDPMPDRGIEAIHEPASLLAGIPGREDELLMTFNYEPTDDLRERLHTTNPDGDEYPPSGQLLYSMADPTEPVDFAPEPAGSWGGIIEYEGEWLFPEQETTRFARAPMTR
ncbi:hypothetical protein [Saliphagus sp. LR7]|uniref:glycoside hydrolase family 130 protein n=1 Tax=Saliphagus sp. LR7 TaxID=2282654 RepID=UPI000DF82A82|nr:hypothetical protein [Saliphagus sp. LR7]